MAGTSIPFTFSSEWMTTVSWSGVFDILTRKFMELDENMQYALDIFKTIISKNYHIYKYIGIDFWEGYSV